VKKPLPKAKADVVPSTLLDFARPLIDVYEAEKLPRTGAHLEKILLIARSIWNGPRSARVARLVESMPPAMVAAVNKMIVDREARFAEVDWAFGEVKVVDDGKGGFEVKAEALKT
jgi:hypothetical protein